MNYPSTKPLQMTACPGLYRFIYVLVEFAFFQDARNGKFSQLLIFKLDRLGRETRLILDAEAELRKLNVRVRSMTEEFDTGSPTGQLMLTMLSGFATHEREVIRERSVLGTNRLAEAGAWLGALFRMVIASKASGANRAW